MPFDRTREGAATIYAGFFTAEVADVSAGNFTVTIGDEGDGPKAKGIYTATAGDIKVDTPNGEAIVYKDLDAGFHPIPHTKVYDAGTTVTNKTDGIISGSW